MKKQNLKRTLLKSTLLVAVVVCSSGAAMADTGEEKKAVAKDPKAKTKKADPDKKADSLAVAIKEARSNTANSYQIPYKPVDLDSLSNSEEVLSFNFLQYLVQRFKFSEEGY